MGEELSHTEDMTIEDFLSGATAYEIADNALKRVLVKRKIAFGTMVSKLEEKQIDLATADIYMWCASTPSSKNDTEDSDGGGSIRKADGKPVRTISVSCVRWLRNSMRNGVKML